MPPLIYGDKMNFFRKLGGGVVVKVVLRIIQSNRKDLSDRRKSSFGVRRNFEVLKKTFHYDQIKITLSDSPFHFFYFLFLFPFTVLGSGSQPLGFLS